VSLPPHGGAEIFLQPGEWCFDRTGVRLRTVLGSCVAVTLWHPRRKIGGMCHFMLPTRSRVREVGDLDGRYGDEALLLLDREATRAGTRLQDYEAKLFGGASMFTSLPVPASARSGVGTSGVTASVSARNVDQAWALVERHELTVSGHSLGGVAHRQVIFEIESGDVWMRQGMARELVIRNAGEGA
jgi:chemotaxis protein CheD